MSMSDVTSLVSLAIEMCEVTALVLLAVQATRIYRLLSKALSLNLSVDLRPSRN